VRVIEHGKLLPSPFVTLSVPTPVAGEEGLLGIALHPDFATNGWVYIYYTQATPYTNRIVRYTASGNTGTNPLTILDNLGAATANGGDNGGAMVFGDDGKLYVGVGVMEEDSEASLTSSLRGKILRINDDGTVPTDNPYYGSLSPPYSLIYSLGYRNVADLAVHTGVGTLYAVDNYDNDSTCDEVNVVGFDSDHGWSTFSCGSESGGATPPLQSIDPQITPWGVASYGGTGYPGAANDLFVSGSADGRILKNVLTGAGYDTLGSSSDWYVPQGLNCPVAIGDLEAGSDGWLYLVSDDPVAGTKGIYRVVHDPIGSANAAPREVSASGYVQLTVEKPAAGGLKLCWEDLKQEAWGCTTGHCPAGSRPEKYTVWEGTLTSPFSYNHTALAETDGTDEGDALMSHLEPGMPSGSTYYLVSARANNAEGTLGYQTGAIERSGHAVVDICDDIGYGSRAQDQDLCVDVSGLGPYPDQDNNSWYLEQFRGKSIVFVFVQFG